MFWLRDNLEKVWFFKEIFLLADIGIEVVLGIVFLSLRNVDVGFAELWKLILMSNNIAEILHIASWVELIHKKKFAKVVVDENSEIFVIYVTALEAMSIHP